MKFSEELANLMKAGANAAPVETSAPEAPKPAGMYGAPAAAPKPITVVDAATMHADPYADLEKYAVTHPAAVAPAPVGTTPRVPVPDVSAAYIPVLPAGTPLYTKEGEYVAIMKPDGGFVRVTSEKPTDPLAGLSAEDKRPIDHEEEARTDLSPRTSGRITFLWETYEKDDITGQRLQKRLANDLARAHAQHFAGAKPYDPESGSGAQAIKTFLA